MKHNIKLRKLNEKKIEQLTFITVRLDGEQLHAKAR